MKCPTCEREMTPLTGNDGGVMFIAEEFDTCTEFYDGVAEAYNCAYCEVGVYIGEKG